MNLRWVQQEIYMEQLEKQPIGRPKEGCHSNSTMYIMKTGSEGQSWLELAQNIQWWVLSVALKLWDFLLIYRCPRRNVPDFGRVFLMLKYTDITQNTYVQS
jgi:hypothetical protein